MFMGLWTWEIFREKNLRISVPRVPRCVPVRAHSILREFEFPFRKFFSEIRQFMGSKDVFELPIGHFEESGIRVGG